MTDPKPRQEVAEETRESLEILDQGRLARDEKLAQERALLAEAHEVRYAERAFKPRHKASLDEIRHAVDALRPTRATFAQPRLPPLPEPPAAKPRPVADEHAKALRAHTKGTLRAVDVLYRTDVGVVVEATWGREASPFKGVFVIEGGKARPLDDVAARIDELPVPQAALVPSQPPSAPPEPAGPAASPAPEPTAPPAQAKAKRNGLFGRGKPAPDADAPPAQPPPAEAEKPPAGPAKGKGILGSLGRKTAPKAPDAPVEPFASAPEEPPGETPGKAPKKRFSLRRK